MAKITSKYQVTVPRAIADLYNLRPGDRIDFVAAGEAIRVVPEGKKATDNRQARLRLFDQATERIRRRGPVRRATDRGWTREDLYTRGRAH
jgi:AbrB family looped-hinge helix DNA binding protein